MKIKLLRDKEDAGQIKTSIKRNRGRGIFWLKGTVIEMSEASGQKYIDSGDAVLAGPDDQLSEGQRGDFGQPAGLSNVSPQTAVQE